jgi:hypothetical protein
MLHSLKVVNCLKNGKVAFIISSKVQIYKVQLWSQKTKIPWTFTHQTMKNVHQIQNHILLAPWEKLC